MGDQPLKKGRNDGGDGFTTLFLTLLVVAVAWVALNTTATQLPPATAHLGSNPPASAPAQPVGVAAEVRAPAPSPFTMGLKRSRHRTGRSHALQGREKLLRNLLRNLFGKPEANPEATWQGRNPRSQGV